MTAGSPRPGSPPPSPAGADPAGSAPAGARVRESFTRVFRQAPALGWSAPGRINLIGEHTDYNDGYVLPFALLERTAVAVAPDRHAQWRLWSAANHEMVTFTEADLVPGRVTGWAGYVAAVVWALREAGLAVPGARIAIESDVPLGAGLSSSAALECAVLGALAELAGARQTATGLSGARQAAAGLPRDEWPALARHAENAYVGVPCGIMDQSAAVLCQAGHALFLDCRARRHDQVPLNLTEHGLAVLVIDTRAPHRLVTGAYAARRASCVQAASRLGVTALRDVADLGAALAALPDDTLRSRVRHVVTENERVLATVALLRAGRPAEVGPLLTASHASLRDDYQVSVAELDVAVDAALAAGALGARMTGGGFGGCVIALVPIDAIVPVGTAVSRAFAARGFATPAWTVAGAGPGATPVAWSDQME